MLNRKERKALSRANRVKEWGDLDWRKATLQISDSYWAIFRRYDERLNYYLSINVYHPAIALIKNRRDFIVNSHSWKEE